MLDFEKLESLLEEQIIRIVAAVGVVLLIDGLIEAVLARLLSAVGSTLAFDGFGNFTYLGILSALVAGALWAVLATTRNYEQPWWLIVVGIFAAWTFVVVPIALELPTFLTNLVLLVGVAVQAVAAVLALVTLDRAVPRHAAGLARAGAGPGTPGFASAGAGPGGYGSGGGTGPGGYGGPGRVDASSEAPTGMTQGYGGPQHGATPGGGGHGHESGGYRPAGYDGGQRYDDDRYDQDQRYGDDRHQGHDRVDSGAEQGSSGGTPAGWYPDPMGEASSRWWDGTAWSRQVR